MELKNFRTCMKGMGGMIKPCRGKIAVRCLIGFVRIAASLLFVWISKSLVDIATGASDGQLLPHIFIMAGIMLLQMATGIAASYYESLISVKVQNDMRGKAFGHVMRSVWNGRESFHSGDTVSRLEQDISVVADLFCTRIPDIVITLCQLVAASVYLLSLTPGLTWLLLGLMAVAVVGSRLFFKKIRKLTAEIRAKEGEMQGYMQENLLHRILALTMSGAGQVVARLLCMQDVVLEKNESRLKLNSVGRGFMSLGFAAGYFAAFMWGVTGIKSGAVTYGMMTAFLQLVGQVQAPIANIARHIPAFIHSLTSVERLMELDELPEEKYTSPIMLEGTPGISLRGVDFTYPGQQEQVLHDLSFEFAPGSMTAITGPTGIGKSTLTKVMLALLTPDNGSVVLTDGDREVPVSADTRCNFMYVPQGNSLMSGSIRQNFQLAKADATDEDMRQALADAAALFVLDLPDGLDTVCTEQGGGLSEGQAQRIAIARALLHPGGILILDEATSALDSQTEAQILENLHERWHGKRTIVFISHRDAVSSSADAVLKL